MVWLYFTPFFKKVTKKNTKNKIYYLYCFDKIISLKSFEKNPKNVVFYTTKKNPFF